MSVHDERYQRLIERLIQARKRLGLSQETVARRLVLDPTRPDKRCLQSFVSKVETRERRLDAIELAEFARVYCTSVAELLGEGLSWQGASYAREGTHATGASLSSDRPAVPTAPAPEAPQPSSSSRRRRTR